MKATLAFLLLSAAPAAGREIVAASRVEEVVVYPGRASVVRVAEIALPAGASHVVFAGLPAALDEASVAASGEGAFAIQAVEVVRTAAAAAPEPRVREIEERIAGLEDRLAAVEEEIANLEETRKFLGRLGERSREGAGRDLETGRLDASAIGPLADAFVEALRKTSAALVETRGRKRGIVRDLEAARREHRDLLSGARRDEVRAVVPVEAAAAGANRIRLRYVVHGATWEPLYEVRAEAARGTVALEYAALVRQATGEDWTDVALSLSTAEPAAGASLPDPPERLLAPRPGPIPLPRPAPAARSMRPAEPEGVDEWRAASSIALADEARVEEAAVEAGVHASFRLPGRATVPSTNEARRVRILERDLPARLRRRAVPERSDRAYLVARIENSTGALLLAGPVAAYQGPDFVGRGRIDATPAGDTLEVHLGPDPSVEVRREVLRDVEDPSSGWGQGRRRVTRRWRTTIENRRPEAVVVDLYERLPVSRHAEIQVTPERASPEAAEARPDGLLRWEVEVPAGGARVVEWGYRVEHPAGMDVPGL